MSPLGKLLLELKEIGEKQETKSPEFWLDKAQVLAALWIEVKENMLKYEQAYKLEIVELIEKDDSVSAATLKVEARSENYKLYKYCQSKDQQIENIIQIAKKRVSIPGAL